MNRFKELRKSKHLTQEEFIEQFNNRYGKRYVDYILGREQGTFFRPLSILERAERELDEDDLQQLEILAKHFLKKKEHNQGVNNK